MPLSEPTYAARVLTMKQDRGELKVLGVVFCDGK